MGQRLDLHEILKAFCENVYYQPPASVGMEYPAIVYDLDSAETVFADNTPYRTTNRYTVTVIDRDPDSDIRDQVKLLPMCVLNRTFKEDNLNHFAFTLFF